MLNGGGEGVQAQRCVGAREKRGAMQQGGHMGIDFARGRRVGGLDSQGIR